MMLAVLWRRLASDRGDSGVFLIGVFPAFVLLAGLAHDLGLKFEARREAHGVLSAAARAGAQQIDEDSVLFELDAVLRPDASQIAKDFAEEHGDFEEVTGSLSGGNTVMVSAKGQVEPVFLQLIGIDSLPYEVEAEASMVRYSEVDSQ